MNLHEYLKLWLDTYYTQPRRAENTVRAYRFALDHLSPEVLELPIGKITAIHLQREINQLAAVYSRQAQLLYVALDAAFSKAVKLDMLAKSPMLTVEKPEHEKRDIEVLTPEEAAAYVREAEGEAAGPLLILMLCLGLRRNEARGLRHGDMDRDGVLHVRNQRTRKGLAKLKSKASRRDIPVPEELRRFFTGQAGDYLVNLSENTLRRAHLRVMAAIGVDRRVTLHGLRHTCATMAIADGVQMATIQHLLGHAHYAVTADTYVHPDIHLLANCTNVIFGNFSHHGVGARLEIV